MKSKGHALFIKGFKYAVDVIIIILFIVLIVGTASTIRILTENSQESESSGSITSATMSSPVNSIMIAFSNPELGKNMDTIHKKFYMSVSFIGLVNVITLILIAFQLRLIFKSFYNQDYFFAANSKRIRNIAIIIIIWVIADYAIRFIPGLIIQRYFISSTIGVNSFTSDGFPRLIGLNFKMLIVSIIIYILSIVFNYGNNLKEESSLTI